MKTVGVCVIAKNEEALIGRMLESIKEADQIVVCDTGSIDRTIEIAKQYTDEVYLDYIWNDDFSGAQNNAKSKMKTDWILSIDSDEYLDCDFSEVRKAVELGKDYVAVHMKAEGGQRLEFLFSRLFRNSPDIFWVQRAHKHLNLPGAGEEVGSVRIIFGHSPAHENDPDRTMRILEGVVAEEPNPGRNLYYLGREYWYKQRYKECTAMLGQYVQVSSWDAERAEAFLIMSQCYSAQGQDEDARDAIMQAIKINPNFKEALEWAAGISKTPEDAKQWKRMARTANNRDVLWDRSPAFPVHDIILLAPHNDDEALFCSYTLMRYKPLVIVITDGWVQYNRGDMGTYYEIRREETINAMKFAGCPVLFLGIKDTELTEENLRERLKLLNPETIYIPAIQGGNPQHDIVGKVGLELFGRKCERYTTYTKTELWTKGGWEIIPTQQEIELKNRMLDCYVSQLNLPSTAPHFAAVRNKSEWLI